MTSAPRKSSAPGLAPPCVCVWACSAPVMAGWYMADQYWVVPIGGLEEGDTPDGAPVAQLPDTSGMAEIV